ncbi:MAG TPA: hypothetical protein VG963_16160, partial [Polyangiaceae bacterium]|nr:hypothetical protein [Polyangiaceae bacterium]
PALRDAVTLADDDLAHQALQLLGSSAVGASGSCSNCHSLGRPTLTRWAKLTQQFSDACLKDTGLGDQDAIDSMLECFRTRAGTPSTSYAPENFGVYATAAGLPWFTYVFQHASGLTDWHAESQNFVTRVGMPRVGQPFTQAQFDVVAEWFSRNLPRLAALVPEDSGTDCTPGLDPRLQDYLAAISSTNWRAKNAQVPLLMYGCASAQSGSSCFANLPRAGDQPYGDGWEYLSGAKIRILRDNTDSPTLFWSRTSADGRYMASGLQNYDDGGDRGQFVDLAQNRIITAHFAYDATFFPDNSGFLVQQGGGDESGPSGVPTTGSVDSRETALVCEQSVFDGNPARISGEESQCSKIGGTFGLYQQLSKSLDGSDYWVVHGSYESDDGGFNPVLANPSAAFQDDAAVTLTPMVDTGNGFVAGAAARVPTSHEGDPILSPSGGLLVTRMKGKEYQTQSDGFNITAADQTGYAVYAVTSSRAGSTSSASLDQIGHICMQGGKATFSFDERWMVFHRYVIDTDAEELGFASKDDPAFADYLRQGSSNLYLVDLKTGDTKRLTNMHPGQYALYPNFRADGWIYFVVRTLEGNEYFAASDAALVGEAASP